MEGPIRKLAVAAVLTGAALAGGCADEFDTAVRRERGLVIVLTGIEGRSPINRSICRGLNDGGVNCAIRIKDWTIRGGVLLNLWSEARNRKRAEDIAHEILRYRESYPRRPVVLVGQSGGGAIAAWIAEALPPEASVDGVVMLAAALSPQYPLARALDKSRRGIVNFHSDLDWVFLEWGTKVYGTMDGRHSSSAGKTGFAVPPGPGPPAVYARLFQVAWTERMARAGHLGGHLTSGAREFVSRYVAPLVMSERWTGELVEAVGSGRPVRRRGGPSGGR